jgi:hypothetical protein
MELHQPIHREHVEGIEWRVKGKSYGKHQCLKIGRVRSDLELHDTFPERQEKLQK